MPAAGSISKVNRAVGARDEVLLGVWEWGVVLESAVFELHRQRRSPLPTTTTATTALPQQHQLFYSLFPSLRLLHMLALLDQVHTGCLILLRAVLVGILVRLGGGLSSSTEAPCRSLQGCADGPALD